MQQRYVCIAYAYFEIHTGDVKIRFPIVQCKQDQERKQRDTIWLGISKLSTYANAHCSRKISLALSFQDLWIKKGHDDYSN